MQAKQRIVLSVSERDAFWEIEVERSGVWHSTIYAGTCRRSMMPMSPPSGTCSRFSARRTAPCGMRIALS